MFGRTGDSDILLMLLRVG